MFDTNIYEAILHNDFLVYFFQQKTTSPTFTLTQSNSEFTPKKLGLKRPKRKFHQTQTMENLWGGEALADIGTPLITTKITSIIGIYG